MTGASNRADVDTTRELASLQARARENSASARALAAPS